ncbi:uncharacterized protein Dwil_GK16587 [Drosophila willistoni]|uniref:Uncharacterized protein n=1 Tax=Drosophila willistoni TaxID=7260 RepID=A0A0Q9WZZ8_DROWI|nr:uncharacterized protein LOC6638819 [Drosophila willistoni]KRF97784.1 uncharacterized protein Dwil_GK16587 [Drosophila willistoni]
MHLQCTFKLTILQYKSKKSKNISTTGHKAMDFIKILLLSLLIGTCLAEKHHKHQRKQHNDDDEEHHYLPPEQTESEEDQPYYKKEKHTSERVVYHKEEEHEEPKHYYHEEPKKQRVDHYHHYDKKPEVKTEHIHYKESKPHIRTDYNNANADLFTPAATQVVYRRRRPSRILYASAPNSVFHTHTQINVQSQDSELNSLTRPDPPIGQQLPTGAAPSFPNCQVAGNPPPGCGPNDPAGAQLPASALAPTAGNFPNQGAGTPAGGQLAVLGNGQRPQRPSRPGGYGGRNNFLIDPFLGGQNQAAGGAQLAAGQGIPNQNQFAPSLSAQLSAAGQAAGNNGYQNQISPSNGVQSPFQNLNQYAPSPGQAPVAQRPATAQAPIAVSAPLQNQFDPSLGGQLPGSAQVPLQNQFDPSFGGQSPGIQRPIQNQIDPALGAQLSTAQRPNQNQFDPSLSGANQAAAAAPFDPALSAQLALGQVPRLANGRQRNRSNYQGLNVLGGNVFGQPHLQGPTNALGNQQDTNIIDGSFYSDPSALLHNHGYYRTPVSGNRRTVVVDEDDDLDNDGFGLAGTSPQAFYVKPKRGQPKSKSHRRHHGIQAAASSLTYSFEPAVASSQHNIDFRADGYHYKKPKQAFEF